VDCLGAQSTIQVQGDIRCAGAFVNTGAAFEVRKRQVTRQRMALVDAAGISTWTTGIVNALILWTTRYMDAALNHLRPSGTEVRKEDLAHSHPSVASTLICWVATTSPFQKKS
jgi:Tn3 transposase DDE domain